MPQPPDRSALAMGSEALRYLRVLVVEDSENDALLLRLALERAGFQPDCLRVDTETDLRAALESRPWDVVVSDYIMPELSGLVALSIVKETGQDLPFIIVSGHINEDTAVAAMKAGAHDYVMKDNLARLGPAIRRELAEASMRAESRSAAERLDREHSFRQAIEDSVPSGIVVIGLDGQQTYVNPAFCRLVGWNEDELVGARPPFVYWPQDQVESITQGFWRTLEYPPSGGVELTFQRRSAERIHVLMFVTALRDTQGKVTGWVWSVSDITERKRADIRLAAEHAITRILANTSSLEAAASGILEALLDALEMDIATLWLIDDSQGVLRHLNSRLRLASRPLQAFMQENCQQAFEPGVGSPGKVWQARQPVWITDVLAEPGYECRKPGLQAGLRSLVAFPIQSAGNLFGVIELFSGRILEPEQSMQNMLSAIGSEIGQFILRRAAEDALRHANDELELRVQQRTAELKSANTKLHAAIAERKRLEQELLEIAEKERRRIALDLHDDLGQKLSGLALMTKGLELKLSRSQSPLAEEAARIQSLVQETMSHTSDLAHELANLAAVEKPLPTALEELCAYARQIFQIAVQLDVRENVPLLEAHTVQQLYMIAQEGLTNAIKHGKATRVNITLIGKGDSLLLTVQNDGRPFPDLEGHTTGMGLKIMNYRASLLGGSLTVAPASTHSGTILKCSVPLPKGS